MPGFDGKGPMGQGPFTGGGRGYCAVNLNEGGAGIPPGRSFGGGGLGRRRCFYATGIPGWARAQGRGVYGFPAGRMFARETAFSSPQGEDLPELKRQAEYLKGEFDALQSRIRELENK